MERKVRVKRLNHQDNVQRSWRATYSLTENFEYILPKEVEQTQSQLDAVENNSPEIQTSVDRQEDNAATK